MRSSFKTVINRRIAGAAIASSMIALSVQVAMAAPGDSINLLSKPSWQQFVVAQGDASLPPPDPNYRAKVRGGTFKNEESGAPVDSQMGGQVDGRQNNDRSMGADENRTARRKWRRQMNDGRQMNEGRQINDGGFAPKGAGESPFPGFGGGRFGGRMGMRAGDGGAFGAEGRRPFKNGLGTAMTSGNMFGRRPLDLTSLNLSADQKQRIQSMREQIAPKTRDLRKTLAAKRVELRDMMFEATASDEQVRAKRREVRQFQDKVEEMQINDFLSIRAVLNPEQRQKLAELKPAAPRFAAGSRGPAQLVAPVSAVPFKNGSRLERSE